MRRPKQVLVFLFRKNENNEYEYCIFYRRKLNFWQAISGGVEDNETLVETVKREVLEETGISVKDLIKLQSTSTIPVINVTGDFTWGKDVYVVTEYSFGAFIENSDIILSNEHKKFEWLTYDEVYEKLKYDSNKTALWELNQRFLNNNYVILNARTNVK